MTDPNPPRWLEDCLSLLLSSHDRETIVGDLQELYAEEKLPQLGRSRANLWYAHQVLSFAPCRLRSGTARGPILALLCAFTALAGTWLGAMDALLRHPGLADRECIAGTIVAQAAVTFLAFYGPGIPTLRPVAAAGCLAILFLASKAFSGVLHSPHFEGYIVLIAIALVAQALLTVFAIVRPPALHPRQRRDL